MCFYRGVIHSINQRRRNGDNNFGEMGTERNGSFVEREEADDQTEKDQTSGAAIVGPQMTRSEMVAMALKSSRARVLRDWKAKP